MMKKRQRTRLTIRKGLLTLRLYRRAWDLEHLIMQDMLIHKITPDALSLKYGILPADISDMYQRVLMVAVPWAENYRNQTVVLSALQNIAVRVRREKTAATGTVETSGLPDDPDREKILKLKLTDFELSLPYRVLKTLHSIEIYTIQDLAANPLPELLKFRGFGPWCMRELLWFIEVAGLESYFQGMKEAKRRMAKK